MFFPLIILIILILKQEKDAAQKLRIKSTQLHENNEDLTQRFNKVIFYFLSFFVFLCVLGVLTVRKLRAF